jgi:hypothetical protein
MGIGQHLLGFIHGFEACTAKHDDGVFNAHFHLVQVGLEQLQLQPDATGFAAQQKLRVGKGQAVGVGLQRDASVGLGLDVGPGVGQYVR